MSAALAAIADPVRRHILDLLHDDELAVGALAESLDLAQPSVSKHLGVLRRAGLVAARPQGNHRYYRATPEPLAELDRWLSGHRHAWADRLDALEAHLDTMEDT